LTIVGIPHLECTSISKVGAWDRRRISDIASNPDFWNTNKLKHVYPHTDLTEEKNVSMQQQSLTRQNLNWGNLADK
jgi:hypothetical protein